MFLEKLPITANGKLDRKALPEPDYQQFSHDEFIAPETDTEKQLAELWCRIFEISQVGIQDNFFDLGGNSLLVVKLVVEINQQFNINLPFGIVYQFPTIEELADIINSGNLSSAWYSLVPIQTKGSRLPLFAIHTISLVDLPRYLGKEQPLYFLRYGMAREHPEHSVKLPCLEELAAHYIKEMQHAQPQGPYYLMGFSFGGIIAYEMACQLAASGQQVNFVGLLDTYLEREKIPQSFTQTLHKLRKQKLSQLFNRVKNKFKEIIKIKDDKYGSDFWPHIYTEAPDRACRQTYQAKPYTGRQITLFQCSEWDSLFSSYALPEQAWRNVVGEKLDVQEVAGLHYEIFSEPYVKTLAEKLITCMNKQHL